MSLFLSEEELQGLISDADRFGSYHAEAETDFKSSERELKLIRAAAIEEMRADDPKASITLLQSLVDAHPTYVDRVKELREKQRKYLRSGAKLDSLKMKYEVWRTYSANSRMGT